ncbi:MAG: ABC transporter substrate-binding protein, partial [Candidatus Rokubacteria bacterium]|nr:ABC transporter substrate-binding protein [Candidatus Rokubacteria bacterium]
MKRPVLWMVAVALALPFVAGTGWAQEIKLGSLNDLTGPTSDVGKDIALGIREAVQYVNDTGGINGKKIRLHLY